MIFLKDPDTTIDVPFDWTDSIGGGITLSSVTHTPPTGLTKVSEVTNAGSALSSVRVSGGTNGALYIVEAVGTLSSGEFVSKRGPVRVLAG